MPIGARRSVEVTVLHVRDCPSVAPLVERLGAAAVVAGVEVSTMLRLVDSQHEADAIGFAGSPTVLVGGRDPFPSGGTSFGCRLYDVGGALEGAPSVSQLTTALLLAADPRPITDADR